MASFEELTLWKKARDLRNKVFDIVKTFPTDEKFKLSDQIIRSSRSIATNIAEGHGRFHFQENIQFCRVARGSISETLNHSICAYDCKYIGESKMNELRSDLEELTRMINGYINYLKERKSKQTS